MATLHQLKTHKEFVEGCFGCKASTLQLAPERGTSFSAKMDKNLEKDRPAYKAMKQQGLQPARVMGAHELMTRAETKYEIESGQIMPGKAKQIDSAIRQFEDGTGRSVMTPVITPKSVVV